MYEEREKGIFQNKEAITEAVLLAREVLVAHAEDLTLGQVSVWNYSSFTSASHAFLFHS